MDPRQQGGPGDLPAKSAGPLAEGGPDRGRGPERAPDSVDPLAQGPETDVATSAEPGRLSGGQRPGQSVERP